MKGKRHRSLLKKGTEIPAPDTHPQTSAEMARALFLHAALASQHVRVPERLRSWAA